MNTCTTMISALLLCGSAMADPGLEMPQAIGVSPGGIEAPNWLADPCPTFSWGSVPGAVGYELAIFWARDDGGLGYDEQAALGDSVFKSHITAPALSWTPDGEGCLDEGGSYVWFVRAFGETGVGPWSLGRQFEVDFGGRTLADEVKNAVRELLADPAAFRQLVREVVSADPDIALRLPAVAPRVRESKAIDPSGSGDDRGTLATTPPVVTKAAGTGAISLNPNGDSYLNGGNVGIGTSSPAWELEVANLRAGDGAESGVTANDAGGAIAAYSSTLPAPFAHYAGRVSLFSDAATMGLDVRADSIAGDIRFYSGGAASSNERMRITDIGNVGIGTTTPGTNLHVRYSESGHTPINVGGLFVESGGVSNSSYVFQTATTGGGKSFSISNTGNVGIGTTGLDEGHALTIDGNRFDPTGRSGSLILQTMVDPQSTGRDVLGGAINFSQADGGSGRRRAAIAVVQTGDDAWENGLAFFTNNSGVTSNDSVAERMIILHNGYVGIGRYPFHELDVLGSIRAYTNEIDDYAGIFQGGKGLHADYIHTYRKDGVSAEVMCKNYDGYLSHCSSSERYKEDIEDLDIGLETIEQLRPVAFNWKNTKTHDLGLIAEEVYEINTDLVTYNDDGGIEGVKYRQLTAVLVNAVNEQQEQISSLKAIVCADHPEVEMCL